jgi:outer membrane protein OmpA-like peptidoglycan-associated protein/tetratricopeptide (TPR) repeat protein
MKKKYLLLIISVLCISVTAVNAQYVVDYKKQGDQYFAKKQYYAAAVLYQKALKLLPDTAMSHYVYPYVISPKSKKEEKNKDQYEYLVYQLGESFRLYKDYKSAGEWYEKAIQLNATRFPLASLWYGVCLRATKNYEEAIGQLQTFELRYGKQDDYSKQANLELRSCRYALDQMKFPRLADIQKLPAPVNDSGSNYAPLTRNDQFYFTSSRPLQGVNTARENPFVNKLYRASLFNDQSFGKVELLSTKASTSTELAAMSLSPDGNRAYWTSWDSKGKNPHKAIYVSTKAADGTWSEATALTGDVNMSGYDSQEPFVASDGTLFFSSNRPGGQGGFDLWYSKLSADGTPGTVTNMGATINTAHNEEAPYYNAEEKKLVFSSDGRVGMGGLDLFVSHGADDSWSVPENMGYPLNSERDDIFYDPNQQDTTQYYTSSDRQSVCCLELYHVKLKHITIGGTLLDCDSHQPLEGAKIRLEDSLTHAVVGEQTLGADGRYHLEVINRRAIRLTASKENYFTKNLMITSDDLNRVDTLFSPDLCLKAYKVGVPIVIPNVYYDFNKATLREESKIVLDTLYQVLVDNPKMVVQLSAHTDSIGSDKYNLDLSNKRAQACVDYLISKGIAPDRLQAKGYGESQPIAPNSLPNGEDNPAGRQLNRRTEFTVLKD